MHGSYDAAAVHRFWRRLVQADRVLQGVPDRLPRQVQPRAFLLGQLRPGRHALLRPPRAAASGRRSPVCRTAVTREAYSHEVSSAGFWPGNEVYPNPAFYSYAYPSPAGFAQATVEPSEALWSDTFGQWLLPYDAVRKAADPDAAVLAFLSTTYRAATDLSDWERGLECEIGIAGTPRALPG